MPKSPAYRADATAAKDAAYRYVNNPFPLGSRRWRLFNKAQAHKQNMDALFDEMEAVYGPIGTPRPLINNAPGMLKSEVKV